MADDAAVRAAPGYLDALQARERRMVDLVRLLVDLDTPGARKDLVDVAMRLVADACRERGAALEWDRQEEAGDHLIARWRGAGGAASALVLAHLDTVWPAGEAERRPFAEAEGRLTGPGVFDMKAGLVQAIFAIEAFRERAAEACDVTLVVTSDEETGSRTSRALIEREAAEADVVLVVEPASGSALKTARKGVGMYQLHVEGRASHAGLDPENGRSAVLELAHQVIALHALGDAAAGTTVTVGIVSGGSARNVVPAEAEASIDLRVVTAGEAERLNRHILGLAAITPGTTVTVSGGINRPPMERSAATAALYERATALAAAMNEPIDELLVGGGSDGNFTAAMGVPTLDGLGAVGGGAHALDEFVQRAAVPRRAALLAALLHDVGVNRVARS